MFLKILKTLQSLEVIFQDTSELLYLKSTEHITNVEFEIPVKIKGSGLALVFDDDAATRTDQYWEAYRQQLIIETPELTTFWIASLKHKNRHQISIRTKLLKGYINTKYIDFDLKTLLSTTITKVLGLEWDLLQTRHYHQSIDLMDMVYMARRTSNLNMESGAALN